MSVICAACLTAACEKNKNNRPNLLIISIESLRADHVGAYGYSRDVTPNIDKLAREGVLFKNAFAQSSWTKPSVASTLTSTYQSVHKIRNPRAYGKGKAQEPKKLPGLRETFPTIPEFFSSKGYRCYGWTQNKHLWGRYGFERGFRIYDAASGEDYEILERVKGVLESDYKPWLIFIHLMSPHFEYAPPEEYRKYDEHPDAVSITPSNWKKICNNQLDFSKKDVQHNISLYDGEIAYTDHLIGRIMSKLETEGLKENTVVVISGDHGEEFTEHGCVTHGTSLYEELIRVPLIMAGPGREKGMEIDELAQNIDIFPTLARLCDLEPPESLQGLDLLPFAEGQVSGRPGKYVYSELGEIHAISGNRFKYIYNEENGQEELYDTIEDPAEKNNLTDVEFYSGLKHGLASRLKKWLDKNEKLSEKMGGSRRVKTPERVIRDLEALGYFH